jgi:RNA polymerase sigma factor (sigma-70 family)
MITNQSVTAALIETNANLTYAFANDICQKALGFVDQSSNVWKGALSAANDGIAKAAQGYDATLGKFAPRFWRCAMQALSSELLMLGTPVSVNESYLQTAEKVKNGDTINGEVPEAVNDLVKLEAISLNATVSDDDNNESTEVGEILEVEQETPSDKAIAKDRRNLLARLVKKLNKRERYIVLHSKPYGEQSLEVIGARFNIDKARVCQLRKKAQTRLEQLAAEVK